MRYEIELKNWMFSINGSKESIGVIIPHTWNTDERTENYCSKGIYITEFTADNITGENIIRLYFGAVFHTAEVTVNGVFAGLHSRSGYTPFILDITKFVHPGKNTIKVVVDNSFSENMLPYMKNYDWTNDGGLIRRVKVMINDRSDVDYVHITPKIDRINGDTADGVLNCHIHPLSNEINKRYRVSVIDLFDGNVVTKIQAESLRFDIPFYGWRLWDCEHPNLYELDVQSENDLHKVRFGVRKIEVNCDRILLNDRDVYLTGCEWTPGSHPDYGMAEPLTHSVKCLEQLKKSSCLFTRFHWQQDESILDWCDENGLLVQEEIPYWGCPKSVEPLQLDIACQQAEEMLRFHYNHPSVICWGVGNELNGHSKKTIAYVDEMYRFFKKYDKSRLVNYVSNSLGYLNLKRDEATLHGDIAMWNEYLGTWQPCKNPDFFLHYVSRRRKNKPLIITEFGLCEPYFSGGDERRAKILKEKIKLYNKYPCIRGYIWFSLNDYRTHGGEYGEGRFKSRIHGSTDFYGNEKPSYSLLCKINKNQLMINNKPECTTGEKIK